MSATDDSDLKPSGPGHWRVHFLLGRAGAWGRPSSKWKFVGKGDLSTDRGQLTIDGLRHRFFWVSAKQTVQTGLRQVRNVVVTGRLVEFEVALEGIEGNRNEAVRVRAGDVQAAQEIAAALPTARSDEFARKQDEALLFNQALDQLGTQPVVTTALVAANVAWFLIVASRGGGFLIPQPYVLIHFGSNFGPATLTGEWWRLFSSMFVHFGFLHLALNMWVLWSVGRLIERMFGSLHYALLYLFAGLCGSLASLWWHPLVNSAGASGAIFGLLGGLLAFALNPATGMPTTIAASQRRIGLAFIAYNLLNGFSHHAIDNACHLGGLAGGFLMGWMLARPLDITAREKSASRFTQSAVLGFAAVLGLAWSLTLRPPPHVDAAIAQNMPSKRTIVFYPGLYRRVDLDSGETVSSAMRAVHDAADTISLNAAIGAVQQMVNVGNAEAAFRLGRYYHLELAEPDYAQALKYYQLAMDKDHAWATNNVGLLYKHGQGVPRSKDKAQEYFRKAADAHNPWGYVNLADLAFEAGGKAGKDQGLDWLDKGAKDKCTLCLIEQAAVYHSGAYGAQPDRSKAVDLLNKAAALGDRQADLILAELHIVGDGVPQSSKTSLDMLKTLSDDGDRDASTLLAELSSDDKIRGYLFSTKLGGEGHIPADFAGVFPQDTLKAIHYWERANQQGSCQSWIDLSSVYDRGLDVGVDRRKAADYVERAVRCDPANDFYLWKMAIRYTDTMGRDHDCVAAEKLLTESLNNGYSDAAVELGYIYDRGCAPIKRDDHHALQIYLLGAKLGVALCENNVGAMIKHGRGIDAADPARGYGWIKLAALNGNDLAMANLKDPLFTPAVRAVGLAQLADIQRRLLTVSSDPHAIMQDPWY